MTKEEELGPVGGVRADATPTASSVVASVRGSTGSACSRCATPVCGHDAVMSLVLGYRHTPHCHRCLAVVLDEDLNQLVARICQYLRRRDCYRAGWSWANQEESFPDDDPTRTPPCIGSRAGDRLPDEQGDAPVSAPRDLVVTAEFDAGDMSCGDLALELRIRMRALQPGQVLRVVSNDPGAPTDIPAWCTLTGHPLRAKDHPSYWIQRKPDTN